MFYCKSLRDLRDSRKGAEEHEVGRFNESDLTLRSTKEIKWQKMS